MADKTLQNLPPEERIKRLKEEEKKKKEEIAQAEKLIKESESELNERHKWMEKVPIPQVTSRDVSGLSESGKVIVKELRGIKAQEAEDQTETKEVTSQEEMSLEESLAEVDIPKTSQDVQYHLPQEATPQQLNAEYVAQLAYAPVDEIREKMVDIYNAVDKKGYITWEEHQFVTGAASALEQKATAVEEGKYTLSELAAQAASTTKQLAARLDKMYHGDASSGIKYGAR